MGGADPCSSETTCNEATDTCSCRMTATVRGGGQSPNNVDLQIQTLFTVINGCVIDASKNSLTVTVGSTITADGHLGTGPAATSGTWIGDPIPHDTPLTIECPTAGTAGKLILTNKDGEGGKDTDRITIKCE